MSAIALRPHPRPSVLYGCCGGYSLFVKNWFWQFSPAGHSAGWHSYIIIELRHSESRPHGLSWSGLHSHRGSSDRSAFLMVTLPKGMFVWSMFISILQNHQLNKKLRYNTPLLCQNNGSNIIYVSILQNYQLHRKLRHNAPLLCQHKGSHIIY